MCRRSSPQATGPDRHNLPREAQRSPARHEPSLSRLVHDRSEQTLEGRADIDAGLLHRGQLAGKLLELELDVVLGERGEFVGGQRLNLAELR